MITDLEREKTMGAKLEVALLILRRISRRAQRAMAYCLLVETLEAMLCHECCRCQHKAAVESSQRRMDPARCNGGEQVSASTVSA